MPVGVNAECFTTSPTLIFFPVALWPLQLWNDEVEKVSTQLELCSNLLGVFRGRGCCGTLPAGRQGGSGATAVACPSPDPSVWFSAMTAA